MDSGASVMSPGLKMPCGPSKGTDKGWDLFSAPTLELSDRNQGRSERAIVGE